MFFTCLNTLTASAGQNSDKWQNNRQKSTVYETIYLCFSHKYSYLSWSHCPVPAVSRCGNSPSAKASSAGPPCQHCCPLVRPCSCPPPLLTVSVRDVWAPAKSCPLYHGDTSPPVNLPTVLVCRVMSLNRRIKVSLLKLKEGQDCMTGGICGVCVSVWVSLSHTHTTEFKEISRQKPRQTDRPKIIGDNFCDIHVMDFIDWFPYLSFFFINSEMSSLICHCLCQQHLSETTELIFC